MEKVENTFPRRAPRRRRREREGREVENGVRPSGRRRRRAQVRRPGAGFGVGVVVARGPASVRAAEAQSAAGVQRDHEGPKSRWSFARRLNDS